MPSSPKINKMTALIMTKNPLMKGLKILSEGNNILMKIKPICSYNYLS